MGKQTFAYSITPALKKPHINPYPKHREVIPTTSRLAKKSCKFLCTDTFVGYAPQLEDAILPQVSSFRRAYEEIVAY